MHEKAELITFKAKISWEAWQCRTILILIFLTSVSVWGVLGRCPAS